MPRCRGHEREQLKPDHSAAGTDWPDRLPNKQESPTSSGQRASIAFPAPFWTGPRMLRAVLAPLSLLAGNSTP
jgi:hypothetical protein